MSKEKTTISIESLVNAPTQKVWTLWSTPDDIKKWCAASPDWQTTKAENDLRAGGAFSSRMEAKDGSFGFDFSGVYDVVTPYEYIEYTLDDNRKVTVNFKAEGENTHIVQSFEAESENPIEMQRGGWQAILDNFKKYAESHSKLKTHHEKN